MYILWEFRRDADFHSVGGTCSGFLWSVTRCVATIPSIVYHQCHCLCIRGTGLSVPPKNSRCNFVKGFVFIVILTAAPLLDHHPQKKEDDHKTEHVRDCVIFVFRVCRWNLLDFSEDSNSFSVTNEIFLVNQANTPV